MSGDLVNFLRYSCDRHDIPRGVRLGIRVAANRIEEMEAEMERLRGVLHSVAFRSVEDDIHWCQRIAREALTPPAEGEE